ncbi:hypothetical protein [Chryseobacterium jejuense]|uniref:Uncharacterized protein n=1 Tax=Chryseobacterium jejuense TaxID=445960 RepID=A0A2X2XF71_CHRJE|nr:hypothetical protein [Chryseobacterium jejuense]SDI20757.1 hypothetical protein SAMN05421542_0426 [Chryseobacterium jejuense]SQB46695.1 Uncharacterised protein [Chryseobacterium jejuense]
MGLPKKTSRNIIVDDIEYSWLASGNDDIINLIITLKENSGQKLFAHFDYMTATEDGNIWMEITPEVVRKVIEYGILKGWKGDERGKNVDIGIMNDKVL